MQISAFLRYVLMLVSGACLGLALGYYDIYATEKTTIQPATQSDFGNERQTAF